VIQARKHVEEAVLAHTSRPQEEAVAAVSPQKDEVNNIKALSVRHSLTCGSGRSTSPQPTAEPSDGARGSETEAGCRHDSAKRFAGFVELADIALLRFACLQRTAKPVRRDGGVVSRDELVPLPHQRHIGFMFGVGRIEGTDRTPGGRMSFAAWN
jgi:hypothetical protein